MLMNSFNTRISMLRGSILLLESIVLTQKSDAVGYYRRTNASDDNLNPTETRKMASNLTVL